MPKTYRVYFNRELEWPQCWSVDEGDQTTEINVCGFELHGVEAKSRNLTRSELRKQVTYKFNQPFAWIEVTGTLRLEAGIAHFSL